MFHKQIHQKDYLLPYSYYQHLKYNFYLEEFDLIDDEGNLILNSGTELVGKQNNVLRLRSDANSSKTPKVKTKGAVYCLTKKRKPKQRVTEARVL